MSDKAENANWFKCRIGIGVLCGLAPVECDNHPCGQLFRTWPELVRHQASSHFPKSGIAVECTAPAPQPPFDRLPLLVDAVQKFLKHDGGPGSEDYNASEIYHARRSMQAAFGFRCPRCGETLPHLYDENCTDYRAATPQVTPTDQPMMCDSCKWAMVANCFHCPGCGKEISLAPSTP